jgi:hypothetical protein
MDTLHVHRHLLGSGIFSAARLLLWAAVAALGFILISNWPGLFAGSAQAVAVSRAAAPAQAGPRASPYVSSDPSLPSASSVFQGRSDEPSQEIPTF